MRKRVCGICRKPTDKIVAKVFLSAQQEGIQDATLYQRHASVGECCIDKVDGMADWSDRRRRSVA